MLIGIAVQVTDITNGKVDLYFSLKETARALKTSIDAIRYSLNNSTFFRGRYEIIRIDNNVK